jgi:tripartite-type tricarboxylate transporter receptor subunit TctC
LLVAEAAPFPCNQEIDATLVKVTVQGVCFVRRDEMKHDSRITPGEPIDDGSNEGFAGIDGASDPYFASARVGEKLDLFHALAQVIEYGCAAIEERATVFGRRDPMAVPIEQAYAERMLQFRDRPRNVGLGGVELLRRLAHGAGLHDGHEDVQILQLQPAPDAIAQLHVGSHFEFEMTSSDNSILRLCPHHLSSAAKAIVSALNSPAVLVLIDRPKRAGRWRNSCLQLVASAWSVLAIAGLAATSGSVSGQTYPTRPITMIVPFAAGGPTDTLARIVAERMKSALGHPIVIENVTGAGGTIGVGRAARSAPDGYSLGIGAWNTHVVNGAIYTLPYHVLNDFEPVALLANNHSLIVSKTAVPSKDLTELIGWIKANEGKVLAGTGGAGTSLHVAGVFFQQLTGTRFQFVPYRGAAPAAQDLIAGQIDLMFDQASSSLQYVRSGKTKAFAIASETRLAVAPDIPTAAEAGLPGFHISVWHALWAPKGTPKSIIAKLNAAVVETLADPAVRTRLVDMGQEIPARDQQTAEALGAYHKAEIEKWWPIIRAADIKAE